MLLHLHIDVFTLRWQDLGQGQCGLQSLNCSLAGRLQNTLHGPAGLLPQAEILDSVLVRGVERALTARLRGTRAQRRPTGNEQECLDRPQPRFQSGLDLEGPLTHLGGPEDPRSTTAANAFLRGAPAAVVSGLRSLSVRNESGCCCH